VSAVHILCIRHLPSPCLHQIGQLRIPKAEVSAAEWGLQGGPYSLNLARINLDDSYFCCDQLPPHGIGKGSYSRLRGAIYRAIRIWVSPSDRPNVDYISSAIRTLLEDGENRLSHEDQTSDICGKHHVDIFFTNVGCLSGAFDKSSNNHSASMPSCSNSASLTHC